MVVLREVLLDDLAEYVLLRSAEVFGVWRECLKESELVLECVAEDIDQLRGLLLEEIRSASCPVADVVLCDRCRDFASKFTALSSVGRGFVSNKKLVEDVHV